MLNKVYVQSILILAQYMMVNHNVDVAKNTGETESY